MQYISFLFSVSVLYDMHHIVEMICFSFCMYHIVDVVCITSCMSGSGKNYLFFLLLHVLKRYRDIKTKLLSARCKFIINLAGIYTVFT